MWISGGKPAVVAHITFLKNSPISPPLNKVGNFVWSDFVVAPQNSESGNYLEGEY